MFDTTHQHFYQDEEARRLLEEVLRRLEALSREVATLVKNQPSGETG